MLNEALRLTSPSCDLRFGLRARRANIYYTTCTKYFVNYIYIHSLRNNLPRRYSRLNWSMFKGSEGADYKSIMVCRRRHSCPTADTKGRSFAHLL